MLHEGMTRADDRAIHSQRTRERDGSLEEGTAGAMSDQRAPDAARAETDAVIEAIGRSRLFRGIADGDLAAIAPMLRQRRYRAGETIFHEGDPGDAMHVIASGRAKISIESLEGDEAILVTLGPGEVFGELVLLDGAPRSAAAIAVEPTVTYILTLPDFGPLMASNDAFRLADPPQPRPGAAPPDGPCLRAPLPRSRRPPCEPPCPDGGGDRPGPARRGASRACLHADANWRR